RDRRVVIGEIAADELGDDLRLSRREELAADGGGTAHVFLQCAERLDDGADRAGRQFGRAPDQRVGGRDRRHGVVEARLRSVAAAHVDENGAVAAAHRDLGSHAVAPVPFDLALLILLSRAQDVIYAIIAVTYRHTVA